MFSKKMSVVWALCICILWMENAWAGTISDAVHIIASNVQSGQVAEKGDSYGSWPGEETFMGAMVNGMVSAYIMTGDTVYSGAAWQGAVSMHTYQDFGQWQIYNFFGDQVLAFARLEELQIEDGRFSIWGSVLDQFYDDVQAIGDPFNTDLLYGTKQYIFNGLMQGESSSNVYYLANHAVAAHVADAQDKAIWRQGVIKGLAMVNDDMAQFPVMALGAATWALATTGPLDTTPVDPAAEEGSQWFGAVLADLPGILLGHQVPSGGFDEGSFFWRFDHGDAGVEGVTEGYTEDAIFGALGLGAALKASDPDDPVVVDLEDGVLAATVAILSNLKDDGLVYEHLSIVDGAQDRLVYASELLFLIDELGLNLGFDLSLLGDVAALADLLSVPVVDDE
jgi:hypothetical protein